MSKKIVFTICSNNYLAQAKVLCDSLLRFNDGFEVFLFVCDVCSSNIDYTIFGSCHVVFVEELKIVDFEKISLIYNLVELNTAIKPFVFEYLCSMASDGDIILYFDPDVRVYCSLSAILEDMQDCSVYLTPHILTPIEEDSFTPKEKLFLQYGLYNLGFIGIVNNTNSRMFVQWWARRLQYDCFVRPSVGVFVDQLMINFLPIFFKDVSVSRNFGMNVAPWNIHERVLSKRFGEYFVNDQVPLIFYHFSNYSSINRDNVVHKGFTRFNMKNIVLKELYDNYHDELENNSFHFFSMIKCAYGRNDGFVKILLRKFLYKISMISI